MISMSDLVSIIMPAYNAASFIEEAIHSVLQQSYSNWELIIINDGSQDDTEAKILSFGDSRIRYFSQENQGVSAARNVGLANMRGDYFCFLDADDAYFPDSLEKRIQVLQQNPDVHFVDGYVHVTQDDLKTLIRVWKPQLRQIFPRPYLMRLDRRIFITITWMIRRNPAVDYRFLSGMTHAEDLLFFIQYAKEGLYDYVNSPTTYYRVSGSTAMTNIKGLERGYFTLYRNILNIVGRGQFTFARRLYLRYRITRILFLSFLSKKQFSNALAVPFKALSLPW